MACPDKPPDPLLAYCCAAKEVSNLVLSGVESVYGTGPLRAVHLAARFYCTLRKSPQQPGESKLSPVLRKCVSRNGHSLHLVLETRPVPAALCGHSLPASAVRDTSTDGHCRAAHSLQSARLGGSRRQSGKRQTVCEGHVHGPRQMRKRIHHGG